MVINVHQSSIRKRGKTFQVFIIWLVNANSLFPTILNETDDSTKGFLITLHLDSSSNYLDENLTCVSQNPITM